MMTPDTEKLVRELADRQEILDCIHRYCHGMDRLDRELVLSAYHLDAYDDHGTICAPVEEFVDFTMQRHRQGMTVSHHHLVMNHRAEIDGDVAHATTYFIYSATLPKTDPDKPHTVSLNGGRYIDRFERRDGRWAIADRVCIVEWTAATTPMALPATAGLPTTGHAARDKTDLQYRRPLRIERKGSK